MNHKRLCYGWSSSGLNFCFFLPLGAFLPLNHVASFTDLSEGSSQELFLISFFKGKTLPGLASPAFRRAGLNSDLQILAEGARRGFQPCKLLLTLTQCWPCLWLDGTIWTLTAAVTPPESHTSAFLKLAGCAYTIVRKLYWWKLRIHKQQAKYRALELAARDTMRNSCLPFSMNTET